MGNFFAELKRRHIYRVAAAYAVVAWVLLQLFNNLEPMLKLPDWVGTLILVLLVGGFPVALIFAWAHELKASASGDVAVAQAKTTRLDFVLAGALVVVIALVSYQQLAPSRVAPASQKTAVAAPPPTSVAQPANGGISIAVLPFVNLSGDANQEFFSDGMTEEITSTLAKVPGLLVVGRTSAFQFKGQGKDLSAIGQALHATYLIEGSVREAQGQVRITAQLIRAADGFHVWANDYDGELKDIFATQENVARSIATALQIPLGIKQGQQLVSDRIADIDTYQQYLRGRALYRAFATDNAIATLSDVVAKDPNFAPAWTLLARAYFVVQALAQRNVPADEMHRRLQTALDQAKQAARQAIRADPGYADGYAALSDVESLLGNWADSDNAAQMAMSLDPNDTYLLAGYGRTLITEGRLKEALKLKERYLELDPLFPLERAAVANVVLANGQTLRAIEILEALPPDLAYGYQRGVYLAQAYAAAGRYSDAADALIAIPSQQNIVSRRTIEDAAALLRTAPRKAVPPLSSLEGELGFVYGFVGAPERVFEFAEKTTAGTVGASIGFTYLWNPINAPLRKTERFKALLRTKKLVDYWRAKGWPDLCHPMGADDFECE